ncbi:MAG: transglycosylase SLT domain-containing protein [Elusimicrobia bacterium]|nr:transglycosylase SLT domain-containing protein [Elusimicrobiota bacterium]
MRTFFLIIASCVLLLWAAPSLRAQKGEKSAFDELDQESEKSKKDKSRKMAEDAQQLQELKKKDLRELGRRQGEDFVQLSKAMAAQYDELARKLKEQRERLRKSVLRQWTEFHESSNKVWVDYGDKTDAVSKVDFEKGKVEIEVLVPVEEVSPRKEKTAAVSELGPQEKEKLKALAEEKISAQVRKMLSEKADPKTEVMNDQLKAPDGKAVTDKSADRFVKERLAPKMEVQEKPVVAKDGKPRIKVRVKVDMAPDHIQTRAARYTPQVGAAAKRYGMDPALIYAVIHTESWFNPKARSNAGAFGLMQLVPRTAGMEAYKFLNKEEKLLTPEYLYDPDNNILLGATYLNMLLTRHFGKIKNPDNRRLVSVGAYNCGPGCMRKSVVSKHDMDGLSGGEVLRLIRTLTPKETQEYVPRVEERMGLYRKL